MAHVALTRVYSVRGSLANHRDRVLIDIDSCLHVAKELVSAAKFGARQVPQLILIALRCNPQGETQVCILIFIRFTFLEL